MKRSKIAFAITMAVSMLSLTACNDDSDSSASNQQPTYLSEGNYSLDTVENSSSIKVMTYNMTNAQGKTATATAMVLFPKAIKPKDGYRVVVWEHGTVGGGDDCAPSKNMINPRFKILADSLLAAGYVIVAPDYEGLGTAGVHPYLNLSSAAKSALFAVQAAKDHYGTQLNGEWMSIGQSQGGHASLGTAEFANTDKTYKGAVAGAPASSLGEIIQIYLDPKFNVDAKGVPKANGLNILDDKLQQVRIAMANGLPEAQGQALIAQIADGYAELLAYAALTSSGIKAYQPDYDLKNIFTAGAAEIAESAYGRTGDDGACLGYPAPNSAKGLQEQFKVGILAFLEDPTHWTSQYGIDLNKIKSDPVVQKFLADNQPATNATAAKVIKTPVLMIQGANDQAVLPVVTHALFVNMKAKATMFFPQNSYADGYNLTIVSNASHTQAIVCRNAEAVDFIQTYMSAGTGIVLTNEQKDASTSPHCKAPSPTLN
ncbi:alpha/beta hydrolase family protein [Acinetobacter celticus]|uniref:Alpha/beta hydrolase n=1 Tax=Acinetobacter celticus TaxID=1891224 RepID=A0A1C3CWT9_9GAMM|nr:lipase family protein [Acinetobacter celticus]MBP8099067.1 alpha/beta hydrolase [Acinetobacter sp.]MBP8206146.1 alpha/beta hydrolase [Acinetobacter sp.]ODA13255.1 alpha/beta hydrolase [Acinetobacter celticus]